MGSLAGKEGEAFDLEIEGNHGEGAIHHVVLKALFPVPHPLQWKSSE
jgi:hypothetical protein